jgi:hypothetical protein
MVNNGSSDWETTDDDAEEAVEVHATPSRPAEETDAMSRITIGGTFTFAHLRSRPKLNGTRCTVLAVLPNTGRVSVKLFASEEWITVKPNNLVAEKDGACGSVQQAQVDGGKFRATGRWGGGESKTPHASKDARKATKARTAACMECGAADVKLKKCGACLQASWCGKECQTKAWPEHKKSCKVLARALLVPTQASLKREPMEKLTEKLGNYPKFTIALPASLTGYNMQEVPVVVPAWMFENEDVCPPATELNSDISRAVRASVVTSIKYFFKQLQSGNANFTEEDIGNACTDVLLAHNLGVEGVRECSAEHQASHLSNKWAPPLTTLSPIPKSWRMDLRKLEGVPPAFVKEFQQSIALIRATLGHR